MSSGEGACLVELMNKMQLSSVKELAVLLLTKGFDEINGKISADVEEQIFRILKFNFSNCVIGGTTSWKKWKRLIADLFFFYEYQSEDGEGLHGFWSMQGFSTPYSHKTNFRISTENRMAYYDTVAVKDKAGIVRTEVLQTRDIQYMFRNCISSSNVSLSSGDSVSISSSGTQQPTFDPRNQFRSMHVPKAHTSHSSSSSSPSSSPLGAPTSRASMKPLRPVNLHGKWSVDALKDADEGRALLTYSQAAFINLSHFNEEIENSLHSDLESATPSLGNEPITHSSLPSFRREGLQMSLESPSLIESKSTFQKRSSSPCSTFSPSGKSVPCVPPTEKLSGSVSVDSIKYIEDHAFGYLLGYDPDRIKINGSSVNLSKFGTGSQEMSSEGSLFNTANVKPSAQLAPVAPNSDSQANYDPLRDGEVAVRFFGMKNVDNFLVSHNVFSASLSPYCQTSKKSLLKKISYFSPKLSESEQDLRVHAGFWKIYRV